jgi:hypothetical protein
MLGIISTNPEINRTLRGPGIAPNDFELSRTRSYLPLHHGWIVGQNKTYWPGSLGQTEVPSREEKLAAELIKAERVKAWMAVLSAVSSVAVAVMLGVTIARGRGL